MTARSTAWVALLGPALAFGGEVSLHEARALARRQAPEVVLATLRADTARTEIGVAGALTNPTLNVGTATQSARLTTGLSVPLPVFGQRGTAIDAARAESEAVALEGAVARDEARWAVTVAWVDLWEATARARLLELSAGDATRVAQIAREKLDAGTGSKLDVLRSTAERERADADAAAAKNLRLAAAARLAPLLGLEGADALGAAGDPSFPPEPPELEALTGALSEHPQLVRDRADEDAAQARVRREERLRWPLLTAQLSVAQFDPTLPGPDLFIGLGFEVPVLSLRGPMIARASAQQTQAAATRELDVRRLRAAVVDAWGRTHASWTQLVALHERVVPALEEARTLTLEGFGLGKLDLLRVLDAQRALLEGRLGEASARASWAKACADLERAAGRELETGADHAR